MRNQPIYRPIRPYIRQQPQVIQQHSALDTVERLLTSLITEYRRAVFRSRMQWFCLGVLACLVVWLFAQKATSYVEVTQQPVIRRLDPAPTQPVSESTAQNQTCAQAAGKY